MALDPTLVTAVKGFEGFTAKAFWDNKQWTNGYGTKAHTPTERITVPVAEQRLDVELAAAQASVQHFQPDMPPGVLNALTDLTFECGPGWQHAGLGQEVKAGNWSASKQHLLEYDEAAGHVVRGIENRRKVEASWFPAETAA